VFIQSKLLSYRIVERDEGRKKIRKIILSLLMLAIIVGLNKPSNAWLRDANIANSCDSLGLGWLMGFYLTGEKRISESSSFGVYYLPPLSLSGQSQPVSMLQIGFNSQFFGNKSSDIALSYCLGAIGLNSDSASWAIFPDSWSAYNGHVAGWTVLPDVGLALSWRVMNQLTFKLQTLLYMPDFFEFGYKYSDNAELGVGLGEPFQFINMRYCF
jgi:hypothetical protein